MSSNTDEADMKTAEEILTRAEQAGRASFAGGQCNSYSSAERAARDFSKIAIERDCFVSGWNSAFWDDQARLRNEEA